MIAKAWRETSDWLDRHYLSTLVITTGAFLLQIFHLYWLFSDVIVVRLTGESWFAFPKELDLVYVVADFVEVPALLSTTILYLNRVSRTPRARTIVYLLMLNTQWLHIFWITDTFVVQSFSETGIVSWNSWVAWGAILIDYLEVPVIIEMVRSILAERAEIGRRLRVRLAGA